MFCISFWCFLFSPFFLILNLKFQDKPLFSLHSFLHLPKQPMMVMKSLLFGCYIETDFLLYFDRFLSFKYIFPTFLFYFHIHFFVCTYSRYHKSKTLFVSKGIIFIGQLPRVSTEDRDRVVSVFEFFVLFLFVSKFSLFLYYKVL